MSKFIVTRQSYWHEGGALGVEIALGDGETWNPGALASRYDDDFFESDDPREVVKAAIRLRTYWRADLTTDEPIAFTFSFNDLCYPGLEEGDTIYDLTRWASEKYNEMPKCDHCGSLITGDPWQLIYDHGDPDAPKFCREYCVEEYDLAQHKELDADDCPFDDCIYHDKPEETE